MKETIDYVKVREDNYASQRDILKVTTTTHYQGGRTRDHSSEAYEDYNEAGVIRWCSNDRCVPLDMCEKMQWYNMDAQRAADERDTSAFIAAYKQQQAAFEADTSPEAMAAKAEQDFERRAAFGPGVEVVNVVTGRRYKT